MQIDQQTQTEWLKASREQRAAYFAWQNASGAEVAPALRAYREASERQKRVEKKLLITE